MTLLAPVPMKVIVDSVIGSRPVPGFLAAVLPDATYSKDMLLVLMSGLLIAIALLRQLKDLAFSLLRTYSGEKLTLGFRAKLFYHAQRLSLSYHDSRGTSETTYRIQHDTQAIQFILIDGLLPFVTAGFTVVMMLYVTVRLDRQLAMVACTVAPVLFILLRIYRVRLRGLWRAVKEFDSLALSVVHEVLAALRVVKAFGQEEREQERFVSRSDRGLRARLALALLEDGFGLLVAVTTAAGAAAVLFIGARHVQSGVLTLGDLLLLMAYLTQLYEPLKTISKRSATLQSHLVSAERVFAVLDRAPEVVERPNARRLVRAVGAVAFRDVTFAYDGRRPVLRGVSFAVTPGTEVGIVGATGAGKTTLVSLLSRFYDPTAGAILLDGVDLRDYRLADLRDQFSIVLQEPVLFSTSIAENIAYGRPGASERDIVAAAQAARAHDFITHLPHGYESRVGERGMQLSGGERQRIALARAFLKDAPILILDEPTSALDVGTEAGIVEAVERLMRGRTVFLITHRHHLLATCNAWVHLEHGDLVDRTLGPAPVERAAPASGGRASGA